MRNLLISFFILLSTFTFAQRDSSQIRVVPLPVIGFNYQSLKTYNLGMKIAIIKLRTNRFHHYNILAIGGGLELFKTNSVTYSPLFYTITGYKSFAGWYAAVAGIKLVNYKILGRSDLVFSPEAGLSFYGMVVTYGYNFNLDTKDLHQYTKHRFGIRFVM